MILSLQKLVVEILLTYNSRVVKETCSSSFLLAKDLRINFNKVVLISSWPNQEVNNLQRQKILMFIYPIYNHN